MKKILSALAIASGLSFGSTIGLDALGEEHVMGGTASAAGRGFAGNAKTGDAEGLSVLNPARLAFDKKVVFNLNFLLETDLASDDGESFSTMNISMPSFNLSFPMGDFGAMGLSLWQHYASTIDDESDGESQMKVEYAGSVYELVPTYAIRIPYLRSFSLGVSGHYVLGSNTRSISLQNNLDELESDEKWGAADYTLTDYVSGTWEIKDHPMYYTGALQYRGKNASYYFSYTTGYTLQNNLKYDLRVSELDSMETTRGTRYIDIPAMFATGISYRFNKKHNVMMDLSWRAWDSDVQNIAGSWEMESFTKTQSDFMASLGYQCDGSGLFYDSYWKQINYRAGAWYRNWYIEDVYEVGGSIGAGFPLGRKGTTIDVALQGGMRFADTNQEWDEAFFAIRIGLTGIGSWGQSRR